MAPPVRAACGGDEFLPRAPIPPEPSEHGAREGVSRSFAVCRARRQEATGTPWRARTLISQSAEAPMPDKETLRRARRDAAQGKSPSTQAGEFVREEVHHIREGVHGARSAKQAIAIGLSKARRAGVALPPQPGSGTASAAKRPLAKGASASTGKLREAARSGNVSARAVRASSRETSAKRARAALDALRQEPRAAASPTALARQ